MWIRDNEETPLYSPWSSPSIAASAQAINRSSVAALAFLVWDILITFEDEVNLVWSQTWSYMTYIYFLARYLSMLAQIPLLLVGSELSPHFHFTPKDCYIWQIYQGVAVSIIILITDVILITRVRALYHGHRFIAKCVNVLFALEIVVMVIGLVLSLPGIEFDSICTVLHIPYLIGIYGIAVVLFQMILFGLTLYKFIRYAQAGWAEVPLLTLLIRDGTWGFFLLLFVYMGQVGSLYQKIVGGVVFPWMLTLCSFCGYRIFLNLRQFGEDSSQDRIANMGSIAAVTSPS